MSTTAQRRRNGASATPPAPETPAPDAPETPAPEPQVLDLASAVASEQVSKAQRVFIDVPDTPAPITASGLVAKVQREHRADGTLGEYLLAAVRKNRDGSESVARYSIAQLQELKSALESHGVKLCQ